MFLVTTLCCCAGAGSLQQQQQQPMPDPNEGEAEGDGFEGDFDQEAGDDEMFSEGGSAEAVEGDVEGMEEEYNVSGMGGL
jgi:hypothetical protein